MELPPEHSSSIFYTAMAGLGGALGYIYRHSRANRKIVVSKLFLAACMSSFIGFHMIYVYRDLGLSESLIGALNGLTAVLGVEFMLYLFERFVLSKFGLNYEQRVTEALLAAGWTPPSSGDRVGGNTKVQPSTGAE